MFHPIPTWFTRHISLPLTQLYARLDERQQTSVFGDQHPARPTPVDVSWMPMPRSHARNDHNVGR